jgi:hypothetical protein
MEVMDLWDKLAWWVKLNKMFLEKKVWLPPWMGEKAPSFFPKLEAKTFYGFQTQQMCNLCQVGIIRVVVMWCAKCKLKGSITSQTPLNWWGRPPKQTKKKKCTNNINKSDSLPM